MHLNLGSSLEVFLIGLCPTDFYFGAIHRIVSSPSYLNLLCDHPRQMVMLLHHIFHHLVARGTLSKEHSDSHECHG